MRAQTWIKTVKKAVVKRVVKTTEVEVGEVGEVETLIFTRY